MYQLKSKRKHTMPKTVGKHKATSGDSTRRRPNKRKLSDRAKLEQQARQPRRVRVLLPSGKTRMITEPR
jgi:hypothetical protein